MTPNPGHTDDPAQSAVPRTVAEQHDLDHAASLLQAVGHDSWESVDPIVSARCLLAVDYLRLAGAQPAPLKIHDNAAAVRRAISAAADHLTRLPADVRGTGDIASAASVVDQARSAL